MVVERDCRGGRFVESRAARATVSTGYGQSSILDVFARNGAPGFRPLNSIMMPEESPVATKEGFHVLAGVRGAGSRGGESGTCTVVVSCVGGGGGGSSVTCLSTFVAEHPAQSSTGTATQINTNCFMKEELQSG